MLKRGWFGVFALSSLALIFSAAPANAQSKNPISDDLKPPEESLDEVAAVYKDMGVLQRPAMSKKGRFLVSSYGSLDFSDGPYSMYGLHVSPGYAISDSFEIYFNFVPLYINSARSIVEKVEGLTLANGQKATILFSKPKMDYGAELLWAPAYGKDSVGSRHVVRSDTFFKVGSSLVQYETTSGMKFTFGMGKTFFWPKHFGFRIAAMGYYQQTVLDGSKAFRFYANAEAGVVGYF